MNSYEIFIKGEIENGLKCNKVLNKNDRYFKS